MTEPSASCLYCFWPRRTGRTWSKRRPASCCQNRNIGSRLFVESPTSMTFFASCICLITNRTAYRTRREAVPRSASHGGCNRSNRRQRVRRIAKGLGRGPEGTKETAPHSLAIAESRLASNFLDRQPALLEHEPGGLEAQVFNCLCRREAGLCPEHATKLSRAQSGSVGQQLDRQRFAEVLLCKGQRNLNAI